VAEGQEDKVSIISNTGGSQAYEDFISALAWEVRSINVLQTCSIELNYLFAQIIGGTGNSQWFYGWTATKQKRRYHNSILFDVVHRSCISRGHPNADNNHSRSIHTKSASIIVYTDCTSFDRSSFNESFYESQARHLGNDEVHIVWSEHSKDYRRGIIPTEFCDVLIIIYPLPNNLFRIQVSRKPEVRKMLHINI